MRGASPERRTRPPIPPPEGAQWIEGADGVRLYLRVEAPAGEPLGVIYFVLGPEIGTAEPYPKLKEALLASGFATVMLHPRGSGFSDGLRGDIDDYALFLGDLRLGLEEARKRFVGKAVFLFGHSAGAALALHLAAPQKASAQRAEKAALRGIVLVNPAYQLIYGEGMGPSLRDYLSYAFNTVFRRSALSVDLNGDPSAVKDPSDRQEALAMQRDPLVVRHFSIRYLLAQRRVMRACAANAARIEAPLFLVQGANDALVDPAGNQQILAAAKSADKTLIVAPRGGHGASAVETSVEPLLTWLRAHATG